MCVTNVYNVYTIQYTYMLILFKRHSMFPINRKFIHNFDLKASASKEIFYNAFASFFFSIDRLFFVWMLCRPLCRVMCVHIFFQPEFLFQRHFHSPFFRISFSSHRVRRYFVRCAHFLPSLWLPTNFEFICIYFHIYWLKSKGYMKYSFRLKFSFFFPSYFSFYALHVSYVVI